MIREHKNKHWLAIKWARFSTGLKLLIILGVGLFPLGLITMIASVQSTRGNNEWRIEQIRTQVRTEAQNLSRILSHDALFLNIASETIKQSGLTPKSCQALMQKLAVLQNAAGHYALFVKSNKPICTSPGYMPASTIPLWRGREIEVEISKDSETLNFAVYDPQGKIRGAGEISRKELIEISTIPQTQRLLNIELVQGDRRMMIFNSDQNRLLVNSIHSEISFAQGQLALRLTSTNAPATLAEFLMAILPALPIMMWAAATIIVWFIADRRILKPLAKMESAVSAYQPGDSEFSMPKFKTLPKEIADLGAAFDRAIRIITHHEADLKTAVEHQARLVREVHHRVKNNLQVIASLINLHARGATNEEVAAAYASIQRRVDALAVVYRNHYAEFEENKGISLRSLIAELESNLRATAPASAADMAIQIDIEPYYANQDVAIPVAFLITEIIEYAMLCKGSFVAITLNGSSPDAKMAQLTILSDSLKGKTKCSEMQASRFEQIVTGLSRQLRSTIDRNQKEGRISLDIAVISAPQYPVAGREMLSS